ncbi:ABC transporter substrate-binding protein [Acetilactobacillus jinshanensis]|uniref:Oligopeptide ABC transporter substrate-binding protein n=1 Tax=Acetilactobacillus jinshanensis TaxID=1720083 RepID=A0A4P6ZKW3_9LACO|nr:ABC transporter substrate-binding protein [Acetilactobacillus jinshanensis]QBP18167.1 oligopeptide ABC transporter substrate-binding protein [Acetilactobacillus jinshanensis]URL61034.1 oligopeptide ABC transporter substrate-binding protein [uncultured bacterium]
MNRYKKLFGLGVVLMSMLGLAACSNNANGTNKHAHLSETYTAPGKTSKSADEHSTLKVAEVASSPFTGVSSPTLQTMGEDQDVFAPGGGGAMFNQNKNYKIVNGGLANLKLSKKNKTATVTLRKNAKWSNGMKVTAKDVEYPYEMMGNKNSNSQQYTTDMNDIKGMAAYHAGKAKTISGITFPDGPKGRKAVLHFHRLVPALKYNGNSFMWAGVEPYEYLKNVPINKLASSTQVRNHPVFVGPYKLKKEVHGESTSWVPNKYYWGAKPKIKHISIQVVNPSNVTAALKSKKYDWANGPSSTQYPNVKHLKDYHVVGGPALSYDFMGFHVGYQDKAGASVMQKDNKMNNRSLRRAMMYALNLNEVAKKFGFGLSYRANTLIPPANKEYHSSYSQVPGFPYNFKKAKTLLKNAGYKKRNGSKWLSQPNGKKLVINFGCPQNDAASSAEDHYYVQQWHKLGLDVKFVNGRPQELNSLASMLLKPKQNKVDVYELGFTTTADPTPTGEYGTDANFNMSRLSTKENTKLLNEMNDKKSFNKAHRKKVFEKWQKYMNKEAVYTPEFFSLSWTPVNSRVKGYSVNPGDNNMWGKLSLTSSSLK